MKRSTKSVFTAVGAGLLLAVSVPVAAQAHVGIDPIDAEPGGSQTVTFTVPNESDTAATVRVEILLPTEMPLASVRYAPTPGWSTEVVEEELPEPVSVGGNEIRVAPTRIVFEAGDGGGILPGQFQEWKVSLGPIPDTGRILLPVIQTYDDGEVSSWAASAEEIEQDSSLKPAPVLFVNDQPTGHGAVDPAGDTNEANESPTPSEGGGLAVGLAISALVLGALGALFGGIAWMRTRKATR